MRILLFFYILSLIYMVPPCKAEVTFKWKYQTDSLISTSPTIVDGAIYFGSWHGRFYALDIKTGKDKWTFRVPKEVIDVPEEKVKEYDEHRYEEMLFFAGRYTRANSPVVSDGNIFFVCCAMDKKDFSFFNIKEYLFSLNLNTGKEKWRFLGDDI